MLRVSLLRGSPHKFLDVEIWAHLRIFCEVKFFFLLKITLLSMHALGPPFKPRGHGARPRRPRHVRNHALEEDSSIFDAPKLTPLQLLLHLGEQKEITRVSPGNTGSGRPAERDFLPSSREWWRRGGRQRFRG